jgi:hypothetical protein
MKIRIVLSVFIIMAMVSGCKKVITVKCDDKAKDVAVENKGIGSTFTVQCPSGCGSSSAWGTDTYTVDSNICKAAAHAGVIPNDKGGAVKVTIVKSLPSYKGSDRNNIITADWASSWGDTAFTVSK